MKDVVSSWDKKAAEWRALVGTRGDDNRRFNSDPVLWEFLGDVAGKRVLDAGCGTGYLSVLLAKKAATVIGVDISEKMIDEATSFAREQGQEIDFRVESGSDLPSIPDASLDVVVANYVLMDLPDLDGAVRSFHRVLQPGGKAILVFSHPCFDQLGPTDMYFDEMKKKDRWGTFASEFIYFHRPLSRYWRAFREAGFTVEDFDEPVAKDPRIEGFKNEWRTTYRKRPWSVAFLLGK